MLINAYKPAGKTPLQVIDKLREIRLDLKDKKIGYAGRLDPMAEGVLLLLVEPETRNRDRYQDLDKEYEFEIMFGVETDTLDVLGLITQTNKNRIDEASLKSIIRKITGKIDLPYPAYSSMTVKSKPLYWWARKNKLDQINIPSKTSKIYQLDLVSLNQLDRESLSIEVLNKLAKIEGDFRQKNIIQKWNDFFSKTDQDEFQVARLNTKVSSGTYIRSISSLIANKLNTVGIAQTIKRTMVGNHNILNSNNFFDHKV